MKFTNLPNWFSSRLSRLVMCSALSIPLIGTGCKKQSAVSAEKAQAALGNLTKSVATDVGEVRAGLPQGAPHLVPAFVGPKRPADDAAAARELLNRARNRVQDLRVAKS